MKNRKSTSGPWTSSRLLVGAMRFFKLLAQCVTMDWAVPTVDVAPYEGAADAYYASVTQFSRSTGTGKSTCDVEDGLLTEGD